LATSAVGGDVWILDLGDQVGHEQGFRRPAVVLSVDRLNTSRAGVVLVVPVTRTRRGVPSHIEIEPGPSGLRDVSYAKVDELRPVSVERLENRCGAVTPAALERIATAARLLLGL